MTGKLANIYALLSKIPVSGDSVDVMATVRQELREIYKGLSVPTANEKKREENDDG